MPQSMNRREMLLAAGGVTFLGLAAVKGGFRLFSDIPPRKLLYTALPYIQPGPASRLEDGKETTAVCWQTEDRPANFTVEFGVAGQLDRKAVIERTKPYASSKSPLNYVAMCSELKLNTKYDYRVKQDDALVAEGYFTTRKPRGTPTRFVAFGDNSYGDAGQRAVAFHAYKTLPDFVMNTGDNVYGNGLNNEYARHFFPIYNCDAASEASGAPLLRSVPFYTVIANHDVTGKNPAGGPAADFDKNPDSLGYYANMVLPANGPQPPQATPIIGKPPLLDHFRRGNPRFPRQANYSFDAGDCHFLCIDSNVYVDPTDQRWHDYLAADLGSTDARWKFVVYHHPAFNVGLSHYKQQHMRLFAPLFEKHGVDFVLSGHEHNYQRTMPIRFRPAGPSQGGKAPDGVRFVPGEFAVDRSFDGKSNLKPDGVIHLTTGAGGRSLYGPDAHDKPEKWLRPEDKNIAYCTTFISDRHSFTLFEINGPELSLKQIDQWGQTVDEIRVRKG